MKRDYHENLKNWFIKSYVSLGFSISEGHGCDRLEAEVGHDAINTIHVGSLYQLALWLKTSVGSIRQH